MPYVFLFHHQKKIWLQNCPSEFKPFIYRRYDDVTFLLSHSKYHIKKIRNCLNHQYKNIRFISETENESSILLIYIKRTKGNNLLTTSVYRKTPISRVFTNFGSFIPKSYKYILLFTLSLRSFKICSVLNFFSSGN